MPKSSKRFIISTSGLNSQGFRMLTDGAILEDFEKNPLMLFNHIRPEGNSKDQLLPIGNWVDLAIEGDNIVGTPYFDDNDEFAMKIYHKVENGFICMCSAGAEPIEVSEDPDLMLPGQERPTVIKWRLKEGSICDIGANPQSLAVALYDRDFNSIKLSEDTYDKLLPIIQKQKMATKKPTKAEVTAAKKIVRLASTGDKTITVAQLNAAKKTIKLADDAAPAADDKKDGNQDPTLLADDEPDGDEIDINADPADLTPEQMTVLILALQKLVNEQGQQLADMEDDQAKLADDLDTTKAETLADRAVAGRKITLAQKPLYVTLAKTNYEGTKAVLDSMKSMVTLKAAIETGGAGTQEDDKIVKLSEKGYDELFKTGELQTLKEKAPDMYKLKFKEKFGKDPKNV